MLNLKATIKENDRPLLGKLPRIAFTKLPIIMTAWVITCTTMSLKMGLNSLVASETI